jgi:hypothetical protein
LAQAALESGWGRSRFARSGNALFGKRTSVAHRGIRPLASSEPVYIERFSHLLDAVASYAFILNSGAKFGNFRKRRAEMRLAGAPLDGVDLVSTLTGYSERGPAYVKELEAMTAGFSGLAGARFESQTSAVTPVPKPATSLGHLDDIAASRLLPGIFRPAFPVPAVAPPPNGRQGAQRWTLPIAMASGQNYLD